MSYMKHYSATVPMKIAEEFEAVVKRLGVSKADALRRAMQLLIATTPAGPAKPKPKSLPKMKPTKAKSPDIWAAQPGEIEVVGDPIKETGMVAAPPKADKKYIHRRIMKRRVRDAAKYLEVYEKGDGTFYFQLHWREQGDSKTHCYSESRFETAEEAAKRRDVVAREFVPAADLRYEPMNFPKVGEIDARTLRRRTA